MKMGSYNKGVVSVLSKNVELVPTMIQCLQRLKVERFTREQGICGNVYNLMVERGHDFIRSTHISYVLCFRYTSRNYPIEDFEIHRDQDTLWEGDQLKQRLQLIDELIDVCNQYLEEIGHGE